MRLTRKGVHMALALAFLSFAIPHLAFGAGSADFFPIIPQTGSCTCPGSAPDWGCVLQVLQNVINAAIELGIVLCVIWIAYGGFSLLTSGGNPESLSMSRTRLLNAIIGLAVILCSWLIVDFVMKAVYDPTAAFQGDSFGPWNAIWAGNGIDYCIKGTSPVALTTGQLQLLSGSTAGQTGSTGGAVGAAGPVCPDSSGCSPQTLQAAGLSSSQALALSCIAMTESSGVPTQVNSSSKACGLFQITNATSKGNWSNPAYHSQPCSTASSCTNATCNLQTAVIMFRQSGYQPWTCPGCNNKAAACVATYDPGH